MYVIMCDHVIIYPYIAYICIIIIRTTLEQSDLPSLQGKPQEPADHQPALSADQPVVIIVIVMLIVMLILMLTCSLRRFLKTSSSLAWLVR